MPTSIVPDEKILGNRRPSVPQIQPTSALSASNIPTVTMTMASALCSTSPTGRMITRSITAPPTNDSAIDTTMASAIGTPQSHNCQVTKVENNAISPWAKLTRPVAR